VGRSALLAKLSKWRSVGRLRRGKGC
jgi:hypothetical protein